MRWQLLHEAHDRRAAAAKAHAWGYPREIPQAEVDVAVWYAYGPGVLFWLHRALNVDEGDVFVHVAVDPSVRGRWYRRDVLAVVCALVQLHGGDRIRFERGEGFEATAAYLLRLGFQHTPGGLLLDVGGRT